MTMDEVGVENSAELLEINCRPSTENLYGEVGLGSYLDLRGKVVEAERECDIHGCGLVRRKNLEPQLVTPDCRISTHNCARLTCLTQSLTPFSWLGWKSFKLQRAAQESVRREIRSQTTGARFKGKVVCLLLFTAKCNGKTPAVVLILTPHPRFQHAYQRLGVSHGIMNYPMTNPLERGAL